MSRQLRLEHPGALWHITSRGNERRPIYYDDEDRRRFIRFMAHTVSVRRWVLHAWVLMTNHYHLLLETPEVGLSIGMKWLNETYVDYFNRRHSRVGHLFQGRFKSILVEKEGHLLELIRYLVLNPVRSGTVVSPAEYPWSNYHATSGDAAAPSWLETGWTLDQFDPRDHDNAGVAYREFVASARGVSYNPWASLRGQIFLGSDEFCQRMQSLVSQKIRSGEHPKSQRRFVRPPLESVVWEITTRFGTTVDALRRKARAGMHRKALAHLAVDECGLTLRDLAGWMNATPQAISKMRQASCELYAINGSYRKLIDEITRSLS